MNILLIKKKRAMPLLRFWVRSMLKGKYLTRTVILLLICAYFAVAYALMHVYGISCVFVEFLGFPCPGCGMTRAALALLRFDLLEAARQNIVIFFLPYVFLYLFFDFRARAHRILLSSIACITMVNWIIKLIIFF